MKILILILRGILKLNLKIEFESKKDIKILRLENKIETFFVYNIIFENNVNQSELDIKGFYYYKKLNVMFFWH